MATAPKLGGETRIGRHVAVELENIIALSKAIQLHLRVTGKRLKWQGDEQSLAIIAKAAQANFRLQEKAKNARMCKFD